MRYALSHLADSWRAIPYRRKAARCLILGNSVVVASSFANDNWKGVAGGLAFCGINLLYDRFPNSKNWLAVAAGLCIPAILLTTYADMAAGSWASIFGTGLMCLAQMFGAANVPLEKYFAENPVPAVRQTLGAPVKMMGALNAISKLVLLGGTLRDAATDLLTRGSLLNRHTAFLGVLGFWFGSDYFMAKSAKASGEATPPHYMLGASARDMSLMFVDLVGTLGGKEERVRVPFGELVDQLVGDDPTMRWYTPAKVSAMLEGKTLILKRIRRARDTDGSVHYRARLAGSLPPPPSRAEWLQKGGFSQTLYSLIMEGGDPIAYMEKLHREEKARTSSNQAPLPQAKP